MRVFIKYILRSMTEKKGRLILLLTAISLSTGLFVASMGVVDISIDSFIKPQLEAYENKDIIISTKEGSFFTDKDINVEGVEDILKEINLGGTFIDVDYISDLNIHGRENKYIDKKLIVKGDLFEFKSNKCIISKRISEEKKLDIGDTIETIIAGEKTKLEICAISSNGKCFYGDTDNSFNIIIPYDFLADKLGYSGKYNRVLADSSCKTIDKSIDKINKNNTGFIASKVYNEEQVKSQLSDFTLELYCMLVIVILMSAIIIYSSFKLIVTERMPVIGTFMSQGATVNKVKRILHIEAICYGIIGGLIGIIFGYFGLVLVNRIISPLAEYGIYEKFNFDIKYLIIGYLFAILLSLISAIIPIRKIKKIQVKDIILNNASISMNIGYGKFLIGLVLLGIAILGAINNNKLFDNISIVLIFVTFIGLIMTYPKLVDIISKILYKLLRGRSKSIVLAINNVRTSKVLLGNISLIIVSIITVFMITSLGSSMTTALTDCYKKLNFDVSIDGVSTIKQESDIMASDVIIQDILDNTDIKRKDIQTIYMESAYVKGNDDNYCLIEAIDPMGYAKYNEYLELSNKGFNAEEYKTFMKNGKGIVISDVMAEEYSIKKGDKIKVSVRDVEKELCVVGIINEKLFNNGRVAFISEDTLENLFRVRGANVLYIENSMAESKIKEQIKYLGKKYGVIITTKSEMHKNNEESNQMLVKILNIFSYMAMIIAALGIVNNILIGFLQRKREIAVFASMGMQKSKRNKMLVTESIITVLWAIAISIPGSVLVIRLLTKFLVSMKLPLKVTLDVSIIPYYTVVAIIIVLVATIPVLFKSKKLSIIEEIKYE